MGCRWEDVINNPAGELPGSSTLPRHPQSGSPTKLLALWLASSSEKVHTLSCDWETCYSAGFRPSQTVLVVSHLGADRGLGKN